MRVGDNELETLHTDTECLEVCADLIASGSHNKARTAIIVLHHLAEILLQRECQEILEWDRLRRWVMKPELTRSERDRIDRSFADKVFLVRDKTTHLALCNQGLYFRAQEEFLTSPVGNKSHTQQSRMLVA